VYTATQQRYTSTNHFSVVSLTKHASTETILVLQALSSFEKLYLSRSTNKLNEAIAQSFSGGIKSPPSMGEGLAIARAIANELDAARFDPLLVRNVAQSGNVVLENFLARVDKMVRSTGIPTILMVYS
jgi:conserved oligomeric Golgi complex subunit 5